MSVLHSPETGESKERVKWEAQYSPYGPGLRPYVKRDFPMMMHLAGKEESRPVTIIDQQIVEEHQHESFWQRGFRDTPLDALAHYEAEQTEFMKLVGERAYEVKHNRISLRAAAEVVAAENAHPGHLPSVPVTPIKRRGRPAKVKA